MLNPARLEQQKMMTRSTLSPDLDQQQQQLGLRGVKSPDCVCLLSIQQVYGMLAAAC